MKRILTVLLMFACSNIFAAEGISDAAWQRIKSKMDKLPAATLPTSVTPYDWLITPEKAVAEVYACDDGKSIMISNGLVARIFRVTPNLATTDIINQMTGETMLRAVGTEGEAVIDGKSWNIGGLEGQPERGYIMHEWLDELQPMDNSFIVEDFEVYDNIETLEWAQSRWALNKRMPTGKSIVFTLRGREQTKELTIKLRFDIYDGVPAIRKSFTLENSSDKAVNIDTFKLERLFMSEPESVEGKQELRYHPNIYVTSDFACGGDFNEWTAERTEHWLTDEDYTSQCNYKLETLCTLEVALERGPDVQVSRQEPFASYHVYEMPIDSYDRERSGLFIRRLYATVAPWVTENPIFMHLTTIDPDVVKTAVDQCAEVGYEMIILSFGSGMNAETTSEEHIAAIKSLVDYAHSKGIEMGGYSLLASRRISDEVDVINPKTGKTGGACFGSSPCICSEWGETYMTNVQNFIEKTGLTLLEHDGSYPGDVCASTSHAYHKALNDSQWRQFHRVTELYHWALKNGVSLNVPDFYFLNGSTKTSIGYRETNWSLPRERQLIHGRQVNYWGTFTRRASMCWTFTPLVQYHGGGAAATIEPLNEHLDTYRNIMMQNYGAGIQSCYRGPRLYDTDQTKACVKEVVDWYKNYREILNSDLIHLRRPDGRDWDGFMHVNPQLAQKGLAMFFNPLAEDITREIKLPLYYTGLTHKASVSVEGAKAKSYRIAADGSIALTVTIPKNGYTWVVIQ